MLTCQLCGKSFFTNRQLHAHIRLFHANDPNFQLSCELCHKTFKFLSSYTTHKARHHALRNNASQTFYCPYCEFTCLKAAKLISHYCQHITFNLDVECPFLGCNRHFHNASSLRAHVSRCHKGGTFKSNVATMPSTNFETETSIVEVENIENPMNDQPSLQEDDFAKFLGLMFLKFQAKYNIPSSTVQSIVRDIQGVVHMHEEKVIEVLHKYQVEEGNSDIIKDVVHFMKNESSDAMKLFSSQHRRYAYFEKKFSFVKPLSITLGRNRLLKLCTLQYVPIGASLLKLLKHEDIIMQVLNPRRSSTHIIGDYSDGYFHRSSSLLRNTSLALNIMLFYDEFQVANPIGTRQTNHKICGFYYVLGNLYKNNRSCLKAIQLCLLCRSTDLKYFGLEKILEPIVSDLKELYNSGLDVPGIGIMKCKLSCVSCDNLGSHQVGGFMQSFSPNVLRICRTCLMTSSQLQDNVTEDHFVLRTPENYDRHVRAVTTDNSMSSLYGIKYNSPLNDVPEFHVVNGLPPDVMHDLLEGVIPYELSLVLKKLITDDLITLDYLNRRIKTLKYMASDSRNKPEIQKLDKNRVIGTASQNWTLLRLLPVLIGSKIPENNSVWKFFLQLKLITEMCLSPAFTIGHIDLLQDEIWNHLEDFKNMFPQARLKPKHHFLMHYPQHIINFGPPVSYWCMRFEAKHKFLKDIARQSNQFKNIPYTLTFKHQLAQSFYHESSIGFFDSEYQATVTENLNIGILNVTLQSLIREKIRFGNISSSPKVCFGSVEYRIGNYVIIGFESGDPIFGKIEMMLLNGKNTWFLVQKCDTDYNSHYGSYTVSVTSNYDCVEQLSLFYYNPLPLYEVNTRNGVLRLISLKHLVFDPDDFE